MLEVGINACAGCHTRVMPDGTYLAGVQGVFDFPTSTEDLEKARNRTTESLHGYHETEEMKRSGDVLTVSVGTGFYKAPSLRGVWYRNAFGHGGWVDTPEEWLDPARLQPEFVPKNRYAPRGAAPGHEFGLKLAAGERAALIAFLKTL